LNREKYHPRMMTFPAETIAFSYFARSSS